MKTKADLQELFQASASKIEDLKKQINEEEMKIIKLSGQFELLSEIEEENKNKPDVKEEAK